MDVRDRIDAYRAGESSLEDLAREVARATAGTGDFGLSDPVAIELAGEDVLIDARDGWEAVRAAHDFGLLTDAELVQLTAAAEGSS